VYASAIRVELDAALEQAKQEGLYKQEWPIDGPQGAWVKLADGRRVLNLCANNYLGLSSHPAIEEAARGAVERWGYGVSSVRFICGTLSLHLELERRLAEFSHGRGDPVLVVLRCQRRALRDAALRRRRDHQ